MKILSSYFRLIGFVLVAVGFAGLVFIQIEIRPVARGLVLDEFKKLDEGPSKTLTLEEIYPHVRSPIFKLVDAMPLISIPAVAMLIGAFLIDQSGNRKTPD